MTPFWVSPLFKQPTFALRDSTGLSMRICFAGAIAAASLGIGAGCGGAGSPATPANVVAAHHETASSKLTSESGEPLYWDTQQRSAATPITSLQMAKWLQSAHYVLLGELHDNPAHHQAQARLIAMAMPEPGAGPLDVYFEHLEPHQELDARLFVGSTRPFAEFADAVHWAKGWPPFAEYQPIFELLRIRGLQPFAANLPKGDARKIAMGTVKVELPAMTEAQREDLDKEIDQGHCGALPKDHRGPMADAQRARDLAMAKAMTARNTRGVLIAGRGHTRKDRGVGWLLPQLAPGRVVLSVGLSEEGASAQDILELGRQYDVVVVTKGVPPREDPCLKFKMPR
jgi:uncharacterized iron-regulated protein